MTEKVNDLHSLEDTISHSFASELVFLPNKITKVPNHLILLLKTMLNIKGALVETKRLEKQEPEERVFRDRKCATSSTS